MSEGKRKCDPDAGYSSSTDKIQKVETHGMSNGKATSSQVIGKNEGNTFYNRGTATINNVTNIYNDGDNQRKTGSGAGAEATAYVSPFDLKRPWERLDFYGNNFVSSDLPVHGTNDFKLENITEQLNVQYGSVRCLSTPNLIPLLVLRDVGEQPDCVTHYFVLMVQYCTPVVFVVTKSESKDMKQYIRRLSQAVSVALKENMNRSVTVYGESICEADLNCENIWEKVMHLSRDITQSESESQWRALRAGAFQFFFHYSIPSRRKHNFFLPLYHPDVSLEQIDLYDNELSHTTVPFRNRYRQSPSEDTRTYMENIEIETTMRIMGSEKTMFFETNSKDQRTRFGLEMAYRLNLDGGTLLIGNLEMKIPSEVCQEVVETPPTSFNDKDRVLGCKHVVVFADKEEDLDQYKTILLSGGKLLVFILSK